MVLGDNDADGWHCIGIGNVAIDCGDNTMREYVDLVVVGLWYSVIVVASVVIGYWGVTV